MPAEQTASANGVNVLMRTIGQAGSSAAVAAVLVHHTGWVGGAPVPTLHGYQVAFATAGVVALVAAAAALCIPGDPAQAVTERPERTGDSPRGARDEAMEGA